MNPEQFKAMLPRYGEAVADVEKAFTAKTKAKLAGVTGAELDKLEAEHHRAIKRFDALKEEIERLRK